MGTCKQSLRGSLLGHETFIDGILAGLSTDGTQQKSYCVSPSLAHVRLAAEGAVVLPHNNLPNRRTQTGAGLWHTAPNPSGGKCQSATSGIPGQRTLGILPPQTLRVLKNNCNNSSGPLRPQKTLVTAAGKFIHWSRCPPNGFLVAPMWNFHLTRTN